jgi:hypothetical protein
MKRFKSILCASLLALSMSSVALAGDISGRAKPGDISGKPGDISGKPGDISGKPGDISGLTGVIYSAILGLLIP